MCERPKAQRRRAQCSGMMTCSPIALAIASSSSAPSTGSGHGSGSENSMTCPDSAVVLHEPKPLALGLHQTIKD